MDGERHAGKHRDHCRTKGTQNFLIFIMIYQYMKLITLINFVGRQIHEVKYPRICPSSSNDETSAPRNKMLSQYLNIKSRCICKKKNIAYIDHVLFVFVYILL